MFILNMMLIVLIKFKKIFLYQIKNINYLILYIIII